jgi:hypothetical protein
LEEKEHEVDTNIALLDNPEVSGYDFYFIKDLFLNNKITDLSLSEYIFHQTKERIPLIHYVQTNIKPFGVFVLVFLLYGQM